MSNWWICNIMDWWTSIYAFLLLSYIDALKKQRKRPKRPEVVVIIPVLLVFLSAFQSTRRGPRRREAPSTARAAPGLRTARWRSPCGQWGALFNGWGKALQFSFRKRPDLNTPGEAIHLKMSCRRTVPYEYAPEDVEQNMLRIMIKTFSGILKNIISRSHIYG